MKVNIPMRMTKSQEKAMLDEIDRQIVERQKRWDRAYEAVIMWTLHKYNGFGLKRLLDYRKHFKEEYAYLCERFQMEGEYPAEYWLKELGYDVEKLIEGDNLER